MNSKIPDRAFPPEHPLIYCQVSQAGTVIYQKLLHSYDDLAIRVVVPFILTHKWTDLTRLYEDFIERDQPGQAYEWIVCDSTEKWGELKTFEANLVVTFVRDGAVRALMNTRSEG